MTKEQKSSVLKKFLLSLGFLFLTALAIYLCVLLYHMFHHGYRTQTAIRYTLTDSIELEGVAAFTEQAVSGSGTLGYLVADGERVATDTQVAEVYTNTEQVMRRERLTELQGELSLLEKSQNANGSNLDVLTNQQQTALLDYLDALDSGDYAQAEESEDDYLLAANRIQIYTGAKTDFSEAIAQLQSEEEQLQNELSSLPAVLSPTNGYFVSAGSARFLKTSAQALADASPTALQSLLTQGLEQDVSGVAGKVVTDYKWHFYCVCPLEEVTRFEESASLSIRFPGRAEDVLPATLESVTPDEAAGIAKIDLSCEYIGAQTLGLGQETAEIIFASYDGIRIDRSALHVVEGQQGVYVKYGNIARFRRIVLYYEDSDYILVRNDGAVGSDNEVRLYDEIIVEGTNLADGKLL